MSANYPIQPQPVGIPLTDKDGKMTVEWVIYFQKLQQSIIELQTLL